MPEPGLVLLNGKIWTGQPHSSHGNNATPAFAEAVSVANGRFVAAGSNQQIKASAGRNTRVIDLRGCMAMPGFIDSHVHFIFGSLQISQVDLKNAPDEAEFTRRIAHKARALGPGKWILGGSWDETNWPGAKPPTHWMIDPVTAENPVCVQRSDGHQVLANSLALKLAGITKHTPDPPAGVIVRDSSTGEPTGILKDTAVAAVERMVPRPSREEFEATFRAGLAGAARCGVTSVHDMYLGRYWSPNGSMADQIELLRRAEAEGWLSCRFYVLAPLEDCRQSEQAEVRNASGSGYLRLGAVKGFADGSTGSRTAWMHEDFTDQPGYFGLSRYSRADMESMVRNADAAGLQIAVHAIGDRANTEMLDVFEKVGGAGGAARRFRIEHAQHVRPREFARFARLEVVASMQPYHAADDGRWLQDRIGLERCRTSFAWRSMLDAGVPLAFGTDWPIAPLDPLLGIWAAVTRQTLDGKHPGGWIPEQRLTLEEALRAYTQGGAYAEFQENNKGEIAAGKLADMVVLSADLFGIPANQIRDERVILTIVGGKVVYEESHDTVNI
ncbi:MAG: amidohydrolase [Candidatus Korobacteraceae bacterium]